MTPEYTESALTTSLLDTPLLYWMRENLIYKINHELGYGPVTESQDAEHNEQHMAARIDQFTAEQGNSPWSAYRTRHFQESSRNANHLFTGNDRLEDPISSRRGTWSGKNGEGKSRTPARRLHRV